MYDIAAQAVLTAILFQTLGRTFPFISKAKVMANHYPPDIQLAYNILNELTPGHLHQFPVKVKKHQLVYPVHGTYYICSVLGAVYQGSLPPKHQIVRMNVKAEHCGQGAQLSRTLLGHLHEGTVPYMHSVEKSQGNNSLFF